jgi:hypothetical protein
MMCSATVCGIDGRGFPPGRDGTRVVGPVVHETPYGTYDVAAGGFEQCDFGKWLRHDRWVPKDAAARPTMDYFHAAGREDMSVQHDKSQKYNPACGWCYLNAPHTEAAHAQQIGHKEFPRWTSGLRGVSRPS